MYYTTPYYAIQCCDLLHYTMLCHTISHHTKLYRAIPPQYWAVQYSTNCAIQHVCYAILYQITPNYTIMYDTMLCCTILHYTMLCYTIPHHTTSCCIIHNYTMPYCPILCYTMRHVTILSIIKTVSIFLWSPNCTKQGFPFYFRIIRY